MNLLKRLPFFGLTPVRISNFMVLSTVAAFFEGFGMTMLLPVLEYIEKDREVSNLLQGGGMWPKIISGFDFIGLDVNLLDAITRQILRRRYMSIFETSLHVKL